MSRTKQQGTAIIVALFLVSTVAIIAITMMERLNRDIRRTQLLLQSTQANLYAQGSIDWAIDTLRDHALHQKNQALVDVLPLSSPVNTIDHFLVSSTIYDAQGCFNLNNVSSDEWAAYFQRLLLIIDPTLSADSAQKITKSVINWIAPVSRNPEEDLYYTQLPQPYRAAHRPLASASEFRLIKGVTPSLYRRILPYIIALPENTLININTTAVPVLQSLSPALTEDSAAAIVAYRQQVPFISTEQFLKMDIVHNNGIANTAITTSSSYFLLQTRVEKNQQQLLLTTLAQRVLRNHNAVIHILWQSKGGT